METAKHIQKQLTGVSGFSRSLGATRSALRRQLWIWPAIAALLLGGVGWLVHRSVENAMRENLAGGLTTILNADVEALRLWTKDQTAIAQALARAPALQPAFRELLAIAQRPDVTPAALLQSRPLADVRTRLAPFLENFAYSDFLVVSPSMRVVGAKGDAPINSVLDGYRAEFFGKVLKDGSSVSKPFRSTLLLPDADGQLKAGLPTMYAAAVIPDEDGKPLALLGLRIRPEGDFTDILQTARFAASGETYVISKTGLLLSKSRFDSDLKRLGLLPDVADAQSILTVEVHDPQVNMMEGQRPSLSRSEQPLTKLAAKAVAGGEGVEMDAYGDYRGVPSVGAWKWLPEHDFGVLTEVDVADVYQPLYVLRRAIWSLLGLLLLSTVGIFGFMIVVARQQRRIEKAQKAITQLGQYTLEEKIGAGGMGSVYRARHAFLRRPTAVKMLNADNVTEDSLARFEREVQLTSRLYHPNTIAVYDYGRTSEGVFYYAMEYLEGINLEDLVKKCGPLPEGRVISILQQVCGSLAEAHDIGLIHRDIKPANIFLISRAGLSDFVKVLDFGLVKAVDTEEAAKLTQANVTVGTPHYLSPEAVERPDSVTWLSDIYAIGAVGYFLLTGSPVFAGKTVMEICMKHTRTMPEPPSVRLGRPVSPGLESLILRCLAKNPKERPPCARALAELLDRLEPDRRWTRIDADAWWASFKTPEGVAAVGSASTIKLKNGGLPRPHDEEGFLAQ
jgi:serine/threonine protein kinase